MTEDLDYGLRAADKAGDDAARAENTVLLAQADTGFVPAGSASPATPGTAVISPDADNKVRLGETVSLKDFRIEGDDLLLVQPDGSQVLIVGGAANLPTFIIGEIEIPQEVLVAALNADGFDVAAGPNNSIFVSVQVPDGSGGDFTDSPVTSIAGDRTPVLELLNDSSFGDGQSETAPDVFEDAGTAFSVDPINDAPVAAADAYSVDEDGTLVVNAASGVLGNDSDSDGDTMTARLASDVSNGSLTFNADGSFSYTPDAGFNGTDSFAYTVNDGTEDGNTVTVALTVDPVNDAPVAAADAYSVDEDGTLVVNAAGGVLGNDSDGDDDALAARLASDVSNGSLTFNADGSFSYTPDADFNGEDSFAYTVNDGTEDGNTVTVTLTVDPVNDAPVASADAYSVDEDGTLVVNATGGVLGNDSDADGDTLTAVLASDVSNGSLTFNADGSFSYTPDADFNGTDSFAYTVNDGTEDGNTVTVTLTVDPVNDAPVAATDAYSVDEDGTLVVNAAGGVLGNDSDGDGDALTARLASDVSNGSLTFNADGSFSYTPDADFNGTDSFAYTVNDGTEDGNTVTVMLTVDPVNDAPVAATDAYSVDEDGTLVVNAAGGVLGNDSDGDGDALTAVLASDVSNGSLIFNADGSFSYTPDADFNGEDSFAYTVNDGTEDGNTVTVTLTVDPVNYAPVAADDGYSVDEDGTLVVNATGGVLANDSDADGDTMTARLASDVSNGSLTFNADGSFSYTPDADFYGEDSFAYTVNDGTEDGNTVTVTLTVDPVNDAPVASADAYSVDEDGTLMVNASSGVLANDSDADGDTMTARLASDVSNGSLSFNADGSFSYTPDADFNGTDSFAYTVNDGTEDGNTVTVTLTVDPVNDAPVAVDDVFSGTEDTQISGNVLTGSGVDSDIDGDALSVTAGTFATAAGGSVVLQANGDFTYDPPANFNGTDSFDYTVSDGSLSDTGTATFSVGSSNDAPVLTGDLAATLDEGAAYILTAADIGYADGDDGDGGVSFTVSSLSNGSLSVNGSAATTFTAAQLAAGLVVFTHDGSETLAAGFDVFVEDGNEDNSAPVAQAFAFTVNPVNDAPVASADAYSVDEDGTLVVNATGGVLGNDSDADGDALTARLASDVSNGSLTFNADGSFSYTPDADFNGTDSFAYTVNDGTEDGNTVTVTLTVDPVNDAPVNTVPGPQSLAEDGTLLITGLGISDVDAGGAEVRVQLWVDHGTLTLAQTDGLTFTAGSNGSGSLTITGTIADINAALDAGVSYQPDADYTGPDSLRISTFDQNNTGSGPYNSDFDQVPISVTPINDAPVLDTAPDLVITVAEDSGLPTVGSGTGFAVSELLDLNSQAGGLDNMSDVDSYIACMAVTGADDTNGTWYVSIAGTPWREVNGWPGPVSEASALLLRPEDQLYFVPDADYNGDAGAALSFRAWDFSSGSGMQGSRADTTVNGGSTGFSTDIETVNVTVTPVNDAPVAAAIDAGTVSEDDALQSIDLLTGQSDVDGDTLSAVNIFVLDDQSNPVVFTDNGDGTISIDPDQFGDGLDAGQSRTVTVSYDVSDGTAETANTATLVVNGADDSSNTAPVAADDVLGGDASFELSSLNGSNGFVLNGIDTGYYSGYSVSSAGDVNGDGIDDILIGAFGPGPNGNSPGETYVVFGSNAGFSASMELTGLNGSNGFVFEGIDSNDVGGFSVSAAGDVNGDGIDDILIGAYQADPNGNASGESYVVFGSDAGFSASFELSSLDGNNGFVLNGIDSHDYSGFSVSTAGDINGDDVDDILIGAYGASPNAIVSGETYVVFGSNAGFSARMELSSLNGSNGFVLNGVDSSDGSGRSVSSAGDVNGDGIDDILVGAYGASPNGISSGETYVVFGSTTGFSASLELSSLDGSNGFVLNGIDIIDYSGISVSSAGDVNGDGIHDILVGASGAGPNGVQSGATYVVFGSNAGFSASMELSSLDGSNGFVLNGGYGSDRSGRSVSSAGDVNGDGIDDILVGAHGARPNSLSSGATYVVFGSTTGFSASMELSSLDGSNGFVLNGIDGDDNSGFSVSAAGDVNGDGIDDILVGAYGADPNGENNAGETYVVFGKSATYTADAATSIDAAVLLGNDTDADGDTLTVSSVSVTSASGASVTLNAGSISYDPTVSPTLQALNEGATVTDTFTYTVSDGNGGTDTATVTLTITGTGTGSDSAPATAASSFMVSSLALNGAADTPQVFTGDDDDNILTGGDGADTLSGLGGDDLLSGGAGDDILAGGLGEDILAGGEGADSFIFDDSALGDAALGIRDLIADYDFGDGDRIDLSALLGSSPVVGHEADYLQMNGAFLEVDVDGTGDGAGFVQIAEFSAVPGASALNILVDDHSTPTMVVI